MGLQVMAVCWAAHTAESIWMCAFAQTRYGQGHKTNGTYLAKIRPVALRRRAKKLKASSAIVGRREGCGQGSPAPAARFDHRGRRYAFPPYAMAGPLSKCHST